MFIREVYAKLQRLKKNLLTIRPEVFIMPCDILYGAWKIWTFGNLTESVVFKTTALDRTMRTLQIIWNLTLTEIIQ